MGRWKGRGTPVREGEAPGAPDPQRQKLDEAGDTEREFNERNRIGAPEPDMAVTITDDDSVHAGKYPTLRWPEYSNLFPMGQPADILRGPIFHTGNLRSLGPEHGWVHGEPLETLTQAPKAAGAR